MKILVVAAHPDDEILGVGGTIAKHIKDNDDVTVLIVTSAVGWPDEQDRKQEVNVVHKFLGVKTIFASMPTTKLDTIPQTKLNDVIQNAITTAGPDIIYTHYLGDNNKDHRLINNAVLVAARPSVCPSVKKILTFETLSSSEIGPESFKPNYYVDISETLAVKLKVMSMYKKELRDFPHPRSLKTIEALAVYRGSTLSVAAAEAFNLYWELV